MLSANTIEQLPLNQEFALRQLPLGPGVILGSLGNAVVSLPLSRLVVKARVSGPVAAVEVAKAYTANNPEPMEMVYLFPLAPQASISRFRAQVGNRLIEGQVLEREVASKTYARASRNGFLSVLFANETAPIFSVSLGLVAPGTQITVEVAYAELLESVYGNYHFRFPLVVSNRLLPGATLGQPTAPMETEPASMLPGMALGGALDCTVQIETGGVPPQRLACSQTSVLHRLGNGDIGVALAKQGDLQARDFVLAYRFGTDRVPQSALRQTQKHFYLTISPPLAAPPATIPRDLIVVMDASDNSNGPKFHAAKNAARHLLGSLGPNERFALVAFNHTRAGYRQGVFCPQTEVAQAAAWMEELRPSGRADLKALLELVLTIAPEQGRTLVVAVIACGHVGNEPELYTMLTSHPITFRFLTVGIGAGVNSCFLRRMASLSRGTYAFIGSNDAVEARVDLTIEDSKHPLVGDLQLVDQGLGVMQETCCPLPLQGLGGQHPVTILGLKSGQGAVEIRGRTFSGHPWAEAVQPAPCQNPALGFVWAQQKALEMADELKLISGPRASRLRQIVLDLSQEYRLLTDFTAFAVLETQAGGGSGSLRGHIVPSLNAADWTESSVSAEGAAKALERARERRILLPPSAIPDEAAPQEVHEEAPRPVRPGLVKVGSDTSDSGPPGLKAKTSLPGKGIDSDGRPKIKIKPGSQVANGPKLSGPKTVAAKGGRAGASTASKPMLPRPGDGGVKVAEPVATHAPPQPQMHAAPPPVAVQTAPPQPAYQPAAMGPPSGEGDRAAEQAARELLNSNDQFKQASVADLRALYQSVAKAMQGVPDPNMLALLERILRRTQPLQNHSPLIKEVYRVGVLCYQAMQARDPQVLARLQVWVQGYAKLF